LHTYRKWSLCGTIVKPGSLRRACINVVNEFIDSVTPQPRYHSVLGFYEDLLVLPAVVDMHVHVRGLKLSYKETPASASKSAALGGIGIIADMPNTVPFVSAIEALKAKLEELREQSIVDYVVYVGVPESREEARNLVQQPGVVGFKLYPEDLRDKYHVLCTVLRLAESYGRLVIVHAEHPELLGVEAGWDRHVVRGCHVELAGVLQVHDLLTRCGARPRVHVTHVSCTSTLHVAKSLGFTVDVTPHHLLLPIYGGFEAIPCLGKVNPPLRDYVESLGLINQLFTAVDAIASDHAPHTPSEKSMHPLLCPPGVASLEHWPRIVLALLEAIGGLDYAYKLLSNNPSRILGLERRGCIEPGCYADVVAFRRERFRVYGLVESKALWSPYFMWVGLEVALLAVRGHPILIDGEIVVEPGFGRPAYS
jgi:dihydroorotase